MEQKPEKPTQRKLKKAKEKGMVPHSAELTQAGILLGGICLVWLFASPLEKAFKDSFLISLSPDRNPLDALKNVWIPFLFPLLAFLMLIFLIAFLVHFLQTGWIWKMEKGRGKRSFRWIFFPIKMGVIALIAFLFFKKKLDQQASIIFLPFEKEVSILFHSIFLLLFLITLGLFILGFFDFFYQKWKFNREMHMTPQEIKEEKKEMEGNASSFTKRKKR
jgi:flagellar biosynthesis protein FlhB